jgi:hypothetical protein
MKLMMNVHWIIDNLLLRLWLGSLLQNAGLGTTTLTLPGTTATAGAQNVYMVNTFHSWATAMTAFACNPLRPIFRIFCVASK